MSLETCPNCQYVSFERSAYCPVCGLQLTHPLWKKVAAWVLLILIGYGWIKCQMKLIGGLDNASAARPPISRSK